MLGLLLDAVAIIAIIYIVNQGQQMDFGPAIISALIISVSGWVCIFALGKALGIFAIAPLLIVSIVVIWMVSGVPLGRAVVAGVIFMVYRVLLSLAFAAMMG